jgi:hypothetical protein
MNSAKYALTIGLLVVVGGTMRQGLLGMAGSTGF